MTNANHDNNSRIRKTEFQAGYKSVLVREELKQKLFQWRSSRGLTDSHYERCLVSALVELGLSPENEQRLFQFLGHAVARDFELSSQTMVNGTPTTESRAALARSLKQAA